ncbi:NUDIX domain-containing protein [Candidatus Nomurabacteria bacterium]|nr:NUDIX domain-containing protein [Candidatus Nomurabacteria bacterium]
MEPEKILLRATLALLCKGATVILPIKKHKIGAGLRNGYGGGIEADEDPTTATARELYEECGVNIGLRDITPAAVIDFHNMTAEGKEFTCRVYVSLVDLWLGTPYESEEMGPPEHFALDEPPLDEMMLADRDWLPPVLAGKHIYAQAWYTSRQAALRQPTVVTEISRDELDRLWSA